MVSHLATTLQLDHVEDSTTISSNFDSNVFGVSVFWSWVFGV